MDSHGMFSMFSDKGFQTTEKRIYCGNCGELLKIIPPDDGAIVKLCECYKKEKQISYKYVYEEKPNEKSKQEESS